MLVPVAVILCVWKFIAPIKKIVTGLSVVVIQEVVFHFTAIKGDSWEGYFSFPLAILSSPLSLTLIIIEPYTFYAIQMMCLVGK